MFVVKRSQNNPYLQPSPSNAWEGFATFNWCPVMYNGEVHAVYRAAALEDLHHKGPENVSTVGHTSSRDGEHFNGHTQLIVPEHDWEKYGCEDPRVVRYKDDFYIFYTAISEYPYKPEGIKVAVAKTKDFKTIDEKHLITPFNAKAMTLFPEPVSGKMTAILTADAHRPESRMAIAQFDQEKDMFDENWWNEWYKNIEKYRIDARRLPSDQVEVGAAPIKTPYGWLLIYALIEHHSPRPGQLEWVYGIEALLLDLDDPRKIIGRTKGPFLAPQEQYERVGRVKDVIFPSGAYVDGEMLRIFYGGADTVSCIANIRLHDLLETLYPPTAVKKCFRRKGDGPMMIPNKAKDWESKAVFNPAAIDLNDTVYILYRAMGHDDTSVIGLATSKDGIHIDERLPDPIYVPRADFEQKKRQGNSGCEDPRVTLIDGRIYMLYTAFDAIGPARPAVSSIDVDDFLARNWNWEKPRLVSVGDIDDKDAALFPRKIQDKFVIVHRVGGTDVCIDYLNTLDFSKEKATKCLKVLSPRLGMWDSVKVGIAGPPIETQKGWLMLYHAISPVHHRYRVGAALLDLENPTSVLSRAAYPIFEPEVVYEKEGITQDVVFPCGSVIRDGLLYMYYGGADTVVGVATMELDIIVNSLSV